MGEAKSEERREIFELAVEAANKRRSIISLKNEQNGTLYMLDEDELEKAAEFRDKHTRQHSGVPMCQTVYFTPIRMKG